MFRVIFNMFRGIFNMFVNAFKGISKRERQIHQKEEDDLTMSEIRKSARGKRPVYSKREKNRLKNKSAAERNRWKKRKIKQNMRNKIRYKQRKNLSCAQVELSKRS